MIQADKLNKKFKKWVVCGLVVGSSLVLSYNSFFKAKPQKDKEDTTTTITKLPTYSIDDIQKEKEKLVGYSMTDAFRYGVINSISDYVGKAPHLSDTISFSGDLNQMITYGYYQRIDGKKQVVITHINPDTISIPNLTPKTKKMIISFAKYHNADTKKGAIKAHEFWHQNTNPDTQNSNNFILSDITKRGVFEYNTTTEEFAKLCAHDEIASRINSLLFLREQYLKEGKTNIFYGDFSFYGKAIKQGKINPLSDDHKDIEQEQYFIVKSMLEKWENKHKYNYQDYAIKKLASHKPIPKGQESEYDKALDKIYTFIWDGKLVNLNYVSENILPDVKLTDVVKAAVEEKKQQEQKTELPPQAKALRKEGRN